MDQERKNELMQEERDEIRREPLHIWISENRSSLEAEFIKLVSDEFMVFAEKVYRFIVRLKNEHNTRTNKRFK